LRDGDLILGCFDRPEAQEWYLPLCLIETWLMVEDQLIK
jgi:hypothetical protein